ncbi:3-hydroxyacyl-ACP dehydratase FabZ [bacterium]|nr:3-hydroxyacyl-ACP dehydratase FabZ [bacterium]
MVLNFEEIKKLLPQRFPFLMLDRIIDYEYEKRIVGIKNVTGNETFFQGHFPEEAIMPGALILEAMAQTSLIYFKLSQNNPKKDSASTPVLFGGIKAKFIMPVVPGDVLKIEMTPVKVISSGGIMEGKASVDGNVVCKAELCFSAGRKQPKPL